MVDSTGIIFNSFAALGSLWLYLGLYGCIIWDVQPMCGVKTSELRSNLKNHCEGRLTNVGFVPVIQRNSWLMCKHLHFHSIIRSESILTFQDLWYSNDHLIDSFLNRCENLTKKESERNPSNPPKTHFTLVWVTSPSEPSELMENCWCRNK